jgi:hypothetical protein
MKCLIACEMSGRVRDAFRAKGHNAWSCDLLPSEGSNEFHIKGDVAPLLNQAWDLLIAFPPCTYLCSSGLHWNKRVPGRSELTNQAADFFMLLANAPIAKIAIENPIGCMSTRYRKPDQIIQPWMFGHPESKSTCLWLKNLEPLKPTNILPLPPSGRWDNQTPSGQNKLGPSPTRAIERSKTYLGIAKCMADTWGK